jgi:hypothetical protein
VRSGERGVTITDVLVSGGLVGLAAVLAFGMQARMGRLFRDQQELAEAQQTLRTAGELVARELRQAGYLAARVRAGAVGKEVDLAPLSTRGGVLRVLYADVSRVARVTPGSTFDPRATPVDSTEGWAAGDVALAVRTAGPRRGHGCVLRVTGAGAGALLHDPARGAPWNLPENRQCAALAGGWGDGGVALARLAARAYRVEGEALQFSPSGGFVDGDWVDLAVGVVDLQVAVRVLRPGAGAEWHAGEGVDELLATVPGAEPLAANVTLVVRAGDAFRTATTTVDLRNLGIGR